MANNISMSFDIDNDDYETFIKDLRENLKDSTSHRIPVLMPQSEPFSWLDIHLISGDYSIILRIDQRNLYVRGYSTNGGTNFWEFSDSLLIPGSRSLRYSGSYAGSDGLPNIARVGRENLPLGYYPLQNAIRNLADMPTPDSNQQQSARYLLTIIQMIPESARIDLITRHIVQNWGNPQPITTQMVSIENSWGTFSSAVQRADTPDWNDGTPLPNVPHPNEPNIWTVGHAIVEFGILLYPQDSRRRVPRAVTQYSSNTSYIRTLVSIEYVRVNNIDGEKPGELYGTVIVKDCWGDHTVYDRSSHNYESKRPGDNASLTGPSTTISGEDAFIISVSLWDHDIFPSPNDEIAKGDVVWDPRNRDTSYDKNLEEVVSGKYGKVSVGYQVITEALSATIKVVMINGDKESPADVYGNIKASRVLGGSSTTRMLFDKPKHEYVKVSPQQPIPLTRPVFPVPVNSDLTIAVDLWDHDIFLSPDDQIALGNVQFTPIFGTQEKNITGKYGEVKVSITCE